MHTHAPHNRFLSLDLFRGFTVFFMFIVNLPGSGDYVYPALDHAEWHGLTLADLVFPWFLLCVGAAVPLALDARSAKGMSRGALAKQVVWRSFLLFIIGLILGWIIRPKFTFDEIRIAGVIQRIAIVYMITGLIYLSVGTHWIRHVLLAGIILALTHFLLTKVNVPGIGGPTVEKSINLFAWLDQQYLPGRFFRKTWDPEGIGGTLPSIASALIGTAFICFLRVKKTSNHKKWALFLGVLLIIGALIWAPYLPLNKNLWTSSFVLATSGLGFCVWSMWMTAEEAPRLKSWMQASWLRVLGQTALTAYIVHWMLLRVLILKYNDHWLRTYMFAPAEKIFADPRLGSLIYALVFVAICIAPMRYMQKRGWLIKV
jgi:predicted acyltransferase